MTSFLCVAAQNPITLEQLKPPVVSLHSQESVDCSSLIAAFVSGLDGVVTVAYIRLLGGQHCKWCGRERRKGLNTQWDKFKHA